MMCVIVVVMSLHCCSLVETLFTSVVHDIYIPVFMAKHEHKSKYGF